MTAFPEFLESAMADAERQEKATLSAWFLFLGTLALLATNYYFRVSWLAGFSATVVIIATIRTFADLRTALLSLGGIALVALGVYAQRHEIGVVAPFVLVMLGARAWTQGVCEAFSKGLVPPFDPNLP